MGNRRSFLRGVGGGTLLAIAGCAKEDPKSAPAAKAIDVPVPPEKATAPKHSNIVNWTWRYPIDPAAPTLKPPIDIFDIVDQRFAYPHPELYDPVKDQFIDNPFVPNQANHFYQAAEHAMKQGWSDDVITAAFLHDLGKAICYEKHTWFSAEMIRPYVSDKVYWLTRNHFDIGFAMYPDLSKVPERGRFLFTENNRDRIGLDIEGMKKNPWYLEGTQVRESDDIARIRNHRPKIGEDLKKILGKTFKLSKKGLAYDGAHCDELWKILIEPGWLS